MTLHPDATDIAAKTFYGLEEKYTSLHDHKYDYSKAVYKNSKTLMVIICPIHGEFQQSHNKHYSTRQGCPECGGKQISTKEKFITKAVRIHGDKYDYSKVDYVNQYTGVTIICREHGEFKQMPTNHLAGKGCNLCARALVGRKRRLPEEEFLLRANEVHNNFFTYGEFTTTSDKIKITCPIHGDFYQIANSHLQGCGCRKCSTYGFDETKPGILYYLSVNSGTAYKIGITNRTVELRFSVIDLQNIEVIKTWEYQNGTECREEETRILREYKQYKYTGDHLLSSGNSELFYCDVLLLDT